MNTLNALLVYPEIPPTFWNFRYALPFIRKKAAFPPLGLVTVGAMLPSEWKVRLVDTNVEPLTEKDLDWADLAFISAMIVQRDSTRRIIRRCKEKQVKVVGGGPLFTIEGEKFKVDHLVLNEAELTLPPFIEDLRQEGHAKRIYTTSQFADLRGSPIPRWELLDLNQYASMSIQSSRGCPHDCEFCDVTLLCGHRARTKTPNQIIQELNSLYDLGWRKGVFFVDDHFIANRPAAKKLLAALIEWRKDKRGMAFTTQTTIELADDEEMMEMMIEAGFESVFIGIETPDEESLAETGKWHNIRDRVGERRDLASAVERIHQAGLRMYGGFILGFDHDPPSIFQRQINFIQQTGVVPAMVGLLQALPGTKLYQRLKDEGRLRSQVSGDNVDGTTNIDPRIGLDTLRQGYKKVLQYIYSPKHYYQRIKTFLGEYTYPSKVKIPLDFDYVLAGFRAFYRLGLKGEERRHFWDLLFWTLFNHPRSLPLAVTLAVYGYHFRKVSELIRC